MEPPSLPRTVSPIWSDIPAYAGDAEQMEEYLSGELTRYFDVKPFWHQNVAFRSSHSHCLPATQGAAR